MREFHRGAPAPGFIFATAGEARYLPGPPEGWEALHQEAFHATRCRPIKGCPTATLYYHKDAEGGVIHGAE